MKQLLLLFAATAALASEHVFSVHDDVLAYPQFEVIYSEAFITQHEARSKLRQQALRERAEAKNEAVSDITTSSDRGPGSQDLGSNGDNSEYIYEQLIRDGRPYLCSIPILEQSAKNESSETLTEADQQKELARAADRGWELLRDLEGKCMYFVSGWWSYSFCYNAQIRQFHQLPPGNGGPIYPPQEDLKTPSFVLGRYDEQSREAKTKSSDRKGSTSTELQTKGETRYLVQRVGGGTTCDLTMKDRKVEVQFHCHPSSTDRIGFIKEVTTCTYLMVIYTPRLCNDVAFLPPRENRPHTIACREVLSEDQIPAWEARTEADASQKFLEAQPPTVPKAGNIEIGGKRLVGSEGRRIEKGKVVTPPEERADVVAKKESGEVRQLSKEDMEKLSINPEVVEEFRKQLQDLAGNKDWTLEIIDEVNGVRQIRGVIESDSDDEDELKTGEEAQKDTDEDEHTGSEEVYKEDL